MLETQNMRAEKEKYAKGRRLSCLNPSLTSPPFHSIFPFRALKKDLVIKEPRCLCSAFVANVFLVVLCTRNVHFLRTSVNSILSNSTLVTRSNHKLRCQ